MRKLKLLMAACALMGSAVTAWAQTDVTSTYLTNADFEGYYSSLTTVTGTTLDNRSVQDPDGWTLTFGGTFHKWDSSVLSSSDATYSSNISKRITIPNTGFGNQTYAFRCQGAKTGEVLRLSQTTKTELPRGKYTLSAKLHTDHKDNMEASLYVNQYASGRVKAPTNAGKDVWDDVSKTFTIVNAKTIEIGVYFSHNTGTDYTAAVDNVTLSYENYTDDLSTMIAKATALSNGSLSSAISTAQGVLDAKDNTVAYQTTIDEAVETLQAAIISAQSADGSSLTPAIQNPGFEGGQTWYVKTTGADTYDVDSWTKESAFDAATYHYSCLATDQKSEGSQSFKVRFNWANASQTFTQRIPGLSLGRYTITADVKVTNGSKSSIDAYIMGNSTKGESVTATTSGFQTITAVVDLNEAGDLDIILGMDYTFSGGSTSSECIVYWDNITLTYNNPEDLYTSTRSSAQETYNNSNYANVTGDERTILYDLLNPDPAPSTVAEYFAAIDDINDAVAAFTAAKTNYDYYATIKAENTAMGATTLDVEPTTADEAATGANTLKVNQYTYVSETYTGDVSELYVGTWTKTYFDEVTNNEHWSGNSKMFFNKWAAQGTTSTLSQTLSLPAGSYALKVAGRGTGSELTFSDGTTTKYFQLLGGTGVGINVDGEASYDAEDATGFANTTGRGWEWRFIKLTLDDPTDVTVTLQITRSSGDGWGSFADFTVLATPLTASLCRYGVALATATSAKDDAEYSNVKGVERAELNDAINADESLDKTSTTELDAASSTLTEKTTAFTEARTSYDALATEITNAGDIITAGTNVGNDAFQIPTSAQTALSTAKTEAEGVRDADDTTASTASSAATTLSGAITSYNAVELNKPAVGKRYQIVNVTSASSFDYSGKALTFYENPAQSEGGYGYQYRLDPNVNYAQGFIFTAVDGQKNVYTLSYVGLDGTTRYLCSQYGYNENASGDKERIRTTTNQAYALKVRVDVTTTANVWKLYNTEANKNIGTNAKNNNDFFTNTNRSDIKIQEASQATVNVTIASSVKYGTRIFPFTPTLPSGVTAYSCTASSGDLLILEKEETPQANTPYILEATSGCETDLEGWGMASTDAYTTGWLTGVYTSREAINGTYVLQNNDDKVGFYKVNTSVATPTVGANRCYLSVPSGARPAFFFSDETTGIDAINGLTSGSATIYSVDGRHLPSLQKGLNIVKTNGKTYKVMVK